MKILDQTVSLIIEFVANFIFSLHLSERYFICLFKTLNLILISVIVCQLLDIEIGVEWRF